MQDEIEFGDLFNKTLPIMDQNQIINTPGLQHIIEVIFFNLDFVDFMNCQQINKAINQSQCFDSRYGGSIEVCQTITS